MLTRRTTLAVMAATPLLGRASFAQDKIEVKEMTLGNPDAAVTVIEYASYTCTHCASFHTNTYPQLKASYIDTNKIKDRNVFAQTAREAWSGSREGYTGDGELGNAEVRTREV